MNSATDDQQTPAAPRAKRGRKRGTGVWSQALVVIALAVAGLLVAMFLVSVQLVSGSNAEHRAQQTEQLANFYAGFFNGKLATLRAEISAAAAAPETVAALASVDDDALAREAATLGALLAYADNVQLVPKGEAEVDSRLGIGYVAVDVIKRAETQPFAGPDGIGGQRPQVFAAHSVLQDGVVTGVLFVEVDIGYFLEPLGLFDASRGQVRLEQRLEGTPPVTLLEWGEAGSGTDTRQISLNAPHWNLVLTPNPAAIAPLASPTQLATAFAVALGLLLGGVVLGFSRLARRLEDDVQSLVAYATRLVRGRPGRPESYKLGAFQDAAEELGRLGAAAPATTQQAGAAIAEPKAARAATETAAPAGEVEGDSGPTDDQLAPGSEPPEAEADFLDVQPSRKGDENFGIEVSENVGPLDLGLKLEPEIFRAYDIRGITTSTLTEDVVYWIGRAFAAEALDHEQNRVAVGRDGRNSSSALRDALTRGLLDGGVDVLDVGQVPTPLLYFANHALETGTGIMITGSHNPPEYNGLKMVIAGETLAEERIQALRRRIEENRLSEGVGDLEEVALTAHYVEKVVEDVVVARPLKVVVDCGNGVAGGIAPALIEQLGCEVVPLYCEVDGNFPNHHPDPAEPENLEDLITVVQAENADLGLAFDGDGDRLGVVTGSGEIIYPDKMLMLFAQDIVARNPGADILYDVKCSKHLNSIISDLGGRPIMWKTGHSHMKAKLKETGALLAGEFSGHICFGERWYGFDDALYSAARLLEIIGTSDETADELFSQFPVTFSTPELKITTTETEKFRIMERLAREADFGDGALTTIDGVRVDYADGWGLVRPSNTSPVLSLRFEADSQEALTRIQDLFQAQLAAIDPELRFR